MKPFGISNALPPSAPDVSEPLEELMMTVQEGNSVRESRKDGKDTVASIL